MPTVQGPVDIAAPDTEGRGAVGLHLRTDGFRTDREQPCTRQVEQHAGVLVRIDETVLVDVEHDNCLGGILDERPVALFVLTQRDFSFLALRYIVQTDDEDSAAHRFERAHIDLGDKRLAVRPAGFHIAGLEFEARIVRARHVGRQELSQALVLHARQKVLDLRADDLVLGQSEIARADLVADANRARVADRQQCFGDTVENGFDRRGRGQRLRDRRLHAVVVLVDQAQQLDKVRFFNTGRFRCMLDLVPEIPIHVPRCSSSVTSGGP